MFNYINNLTTANLIFLAKQYCNISFTKDEIEPILPFLKSIFMDYYNNPSKRNEYRNELKSKTNENTYNKIIYLLEKFNLK